MTDIVFIFEVHQPYRLRRDFFWEGKAFKRVKKEELFNYYFDDKLNREVFERACRKCYFPSNRILIDLIDRHKRDSKKVKVSFSVSGVFLEQCETFNKDLLESFKQLAESGCVEYLGQTYYHSLASLYPQKEEFMEQVEMHRQAVRDMLGYTPTVFENTELLYNNAIAKTIEEMNYDGIFTEGAERILRGNSPNYVYKPKNCRKLKVLLRNYKLTDDIGFRFSARWWSEWPLTAEKYARWLAATPGQCINIFPDYETFGEHHWPETGIHEFLKHLPQEILKWEHLQMATPSEVLRKYEPAEEVDVPELGGTVSWGDLNRDVSGWLGNTLQWAYYTSVYRLDPLIREMENEEFSKIWRYLQTSDNVYYMFTASGGPREVHSYFSSFSSPADAFLTAQAVAYDFESRLKLALLTANQPFLFYTGVGKEKFTGTIAFSLKGFLKALEEVNIKSIEFHSSRRDFEKWVEESFKDKLLAENLRKIMKDKISGEPLRKALKKAVNQRVEELEKLVKETTRLF